MKIGYFFCFRSVVARFFFLCFFFFSSFYAISIFVWFALVFVLFLFCFAFELCVQSQCIRTFSFSVTGTVSVCISNCLIVICVVWLLHCSLLAAICCTKQTSKPSSMLSGVHHAYTQQTLKWSSEIKSVLFLLSVYWLKYHGNKNSTLQPQWKSPQKELRLWLW